MHSKLSWLEYFLAELVYQAAIDLLIEPRWHRANLGVSILALGLELREREP